MATPSDDELEYLSPGFNPATLTVPRLRSILVSHDIPYVASAKKQDLIDIFNDKLVPRSRRILAARSRTKRTSKGITDMPSSQESTEAGDNEDTKDSMPPPPTPRVRKKSARASTEESASEGPARSKTPAARRSSTKHPRASDSEGGLDGDGSKPLVRKTRRSEVMPTVTPSVKIEEPAEITARTSLGESAFSYDNPFQSGSSPITASENRRKSSGASRERRKSSSRRRRTDGTDGDESHIKQEDGVVVPTSRTFEVPLARVRKSNIKQEPEETKDALEPGEEFTPEEQLELVRERAANGETDILPPRRNRRARQSSGISKSAPWVVIMTLLTGFAGWWRKEKIEIGYCGLGKMPQTTISNVQIPEWATVLQPQCEPCPQHAYCYPDFEARCEPDFILVPHPMSFGGLVPLPPACEPDGEKVRKVKAVADKAVEELRERRAKWECGDLVEKDGTESTTVEVDEKTLKAEVSRKRRKGMTEAEFEDLWKGAIGEIIGREEVTSTLDQNTHLDTLTSNSLARLPLRCALRRSARLTLARYRVELAGLITLLSFVAAIRSYISTLRSDTARVPMLVSTTLDRLATQAALHAQGSSPEPWISVGQMRDDVLRDEFSAKRREAIWKRVKTVVEMNANVRPSVREGRAGEVSRVWEWIGSVGVLEDSRSAGRRESGRYSLGPVTSDGRASPKLEEPRQWDEGRPIY